MLLNNYLQIVNLCKGEQNCNINNYYCNYFVNKIYFTNQFCNFTELSFDVVKSNWS